MWADSFIPTVASPFHSLVTTNPQYTVLRASTIAPSPLAPMFWAKLASILLYTYTHRCASGFKLPSL